MFLKNIILPSIKLSSAKLFSVVMQFVFVVTISRNMHIDLVGFYTLSMAIISPVILSCSFDANTKVLSNKNDENNLFILFFIWILLFLLFLIPVFLLFDNQFYLILLAALIIKICESFTDFELANLRVMEKDNLYAYQLIIRSLCIYVLSSLIFITTSSIFLFLYSCILFCLLIIIYAFYSLKRYGFYFQFSFHNSLSYIKNNYLLSLSLYFKYFSSGILRYSVIIFYDLATLGFLTPVFYFMNGMSVILSSIESVIVVQVLKSKNYLTQKLKLLNILKNFTFFYFIFGSLVYFLQDIYYRIFFEDQDNYSSLILLFYIGTLFFSLRGILRVISFNHNLANYQLKIQISFCIILASLIVFFNLIFGIFAFPLAYIFSNIIIITIYLFLLRHHGR